jgi:hypothetical protein
MAILRTRPILQELTYPSWIPSMPKGIQRILDGDVCSFEEALRCVISAYQEAERYARQCNHHRWADELSHFGALFAPDTAVFLDCSCRATRHTDDEAERQRKAVQEFREHAGEFGEMISDALDDLLLLACNPDELVDLWPVNDPSLAVHPRPRSAHPNASS